MTIKLTEEQQYKMLENINLKPFETYLSSITGIQVVLRKVFISAANRPKMNLIMENIPNDKLGCFAPCFESVSIETFGACTVETYIKDAKTDEYIDKTWICIPSMHIFYKTKSGGSNGIALTRNNRYDYEAQTWSVRDNDNQAHTLIKEA